MKILQSLGQRSGTEGVFSYARTAAGIHIIPISAESVTERTLEAVKWDTLLTLLQNEGSTAFRLTDAEDPKETSLYGIIKTAGFTQAYCPYIAAILEHEGSIDHAHPRDQPMMLKSQVIKDTKT